MGAGLIMVQQRGGSVCLVVGMMRLWPILGWPAIMVLCWEWVKASCVLKSACGGQWQVQRAWQEVMLTARGMETLGLDARHFNAPRNDLPRACSTPDGVKWDVNVAHEDWGSGVVKRAVGSATALSIAISSA